MNKEQREAAIVEQQLNIAYLDHLLNTTCDESREYESIYVRWLGACDYLERLENESDDLCD